MSDGKALRLPSFIHVGPPRTGTTWLHEVLTGHVGLPSEKETRFFDVRYDRGVQWYCNLFGDYPADAPAGEMGPTYFSNAIARERIKASHSRLQNNRHFSRASRKIVFAVSAAPHRSAVR